MYRITPRLHMSQLCWQHTVLSNTYLLTYAHRSQRSIGHQRPPTIAPCSGLLLSFRTSWSPAVSALLQCLVSNSGTLHWFITTDQSQQQRQQWGRISWNASIRWTKAWHFSLSSWKPTSTSRTQNNPTPAEKSKKENIQQKSKHPGKYPNKLCHCLKLSGIAQSVVCWVCCQAWCSIAGFRSSSEPPVEGIFFLGVNMVSDSISQNSFGWEYKPSSSLWTHAFHCTDSTNPDIHVLDGWMPATKTHPACTIHGDKMWLPLWLY